GSHEKMIEDSVRLHSGHLALQAPGYLESRTLEHFVELDPELTALVEGTEGVEGWAPRVVAFGLLSREAATQGVALLGLDPSRELGVTSLADRLVRGRFVGSGAAREIVLGKRLAQNLEADLGDVLLLYSVAYSLETAYELFTVVGVVDLLEPALDRSLAILSLADAREFFAYGERVSEVAVLVRDADAVAPVAAALRAGLAERSGEPLALHTWEALQPELQQFVVLDDAGMYLLLVVLVVVVAFGILNTLLMSILERTRELGVLLALGLRPAAIFRLVYWESLMISGVGLVIGLALAIPLVLYFEAHPIPITGDAAAGALDMFGMEPVITWKLKPLNPLGSALTILGVATLAALYPAFRASRSRPVDALRSL
ncbi:MAG: FtsX-like permease family protein, partial [Myxococcota bacterium]